MSDVGALLAPHSSGSGSGSGSKIQVVTYIPKIVSDVIRRKLFSIAANVYDINMKRPMVVMGPEDVKPCADILWPLMPLNMLFPDETQSSSGKKYIGVHLPNILSLENWREHCSFHFYKDSDLMLSMDMDTFRSFLDGCTVFLNYLKRIDKSVIAVGEGIPDCPPPIVIKSFSRERKIIMSVNDRPFPSKDGAIPVRFSPSITLRHQIKSGESYYTQAKQSIVLAGSNIWYFREGGYLEFENQIFSCFIFYHTIMISNFVILYLYSL